MRKKKKKEEEEDIVPTHNGILLSHKKEQNRAICSIKPFKLLLLLVGPQGRDAGKCDLLKGQHLPQ